MIAIRVETRIDGVVCSIRVHEVPEAKVPAFVKSLNKCQRVMAQWPV